MDNNESINLTCPNCESDNVGRSRKSKSLVGYLLLLIGIPIPVFKKEYHCFECYTDFKIEKDS